MGNRKGQRSPQDVRGAREVLRVEKALEGGLQGVGDKAIWLREPLPHSRGDHNALLSSISAHYYAHTLESIPNHIIHLLHPMNIEHKGFLKLIIS